MDWLELFLPIIRDVVITLVLLVAGLAVKKWQNIQLDGWVKEIIVDGVLFVQEKFWQHTGEEKFEIAKQWIVERLNEKGINVSEEWLEGLIDAIVNQLRAEFGEQGWYRNDC